MSEKFQNKYRIASHRKPGWDYSSDGQYFITLVVQKRYQVLGYIETHKMILNAWGEIVLEELNKSFKMRKELFCDSFVIMPNHLHAIITIDNTGVGMNGMEANGIGMHNIGTHNIGTHGRASLQNQTQKWERKPKSISSFIAGFKSATNTVIDNAIDGDCNIYPELGKFNRNNHFWQPNYYDHIIRDQKTYDYIADYIQNNPAKWKEDKFYGKE